MNINKRIIVGLLGGGVASLLAFGGVKVGEKVHYDNQVKYFGGLRGDFNKALPSFGYGTGWTIPKWEDLGFWKTHFERREDNQKMQHGPDNIQKLKSPEELRDACYKIISEKGSVYKNCNGNAGWCDTCLFDRGWYPDKKDY